VKDHYDWRLLNRAAHHLLYLKGLDLDPTRVVRISEDIGSLILPQSLEKDALLLAAFSTRDQYFRSCLSLGSAATKRALSASVLIWLDSIDIDDELAVRRGTSAGFSLFHRKDASYASQSFPRKAVFRLDGINCVALSSVKLSQLS